MEITVILILLAFGAVLGFVGGLLGVGGGMFGILLLAVGFGVDQQHAQGTSLVMVVPNVGIGLWRYWRKKPLDPRLALALALPAFPLTFLAAHLATHLPSAPLRTAFAVFVTIIGGYMVYRGLGKPKDVVGPHEELAALSESVAASPEDPSTFSSEGATPPRERMADQRSRRWPLALAIGAFGGALSGLFGIGGAIFSVPLVSFLFAYPQTVAQGLGLALVAPGTVVGVATYAWAGDVDWNLGVPLALGSMATVPLGVHFAHRLPERLLRLVFASLMFLTAALLLAHIH